MALEGLEQLIFDLDLRRQHSPAAAKLYRSVIEFDTYIRNNRDFIPNYGERYRRGRHDHHVIRGVNDQPGRQQALREETADAVDAERRSSASPDTDQGAERRFG